MKFQNVSGVKNYSIEESLERKNLISKISSWLELWGYKYVEVPSLISSNIVKDAVNGTENKMFEIDYMCLIPEVTKYIVNFGTQRLGGNKIYYVAKCFRNESTTDSERLKEFTQIGVEILMENSLDARKIVRKDLINLLNVLYLNKEEVSLIDGCERGLNLYNDASKTFEVVTKNLNKQLIGGGSYDGGAGWALGLERLIKFYENNRISK
jgi:histidyl-tRNA synthetase